MKEKLKRLSALALVMIFLAVLCVNASAAPNVKSYNNGTRHVVCTTLSSSAQGYYTSSYTYEELSVKTGSQVLSSLYTLMKSTHTYKSNYDDCRDLARYTDCEGGKGVDNQLTTIYTSYQSNVSEYVSGTGWNREHVWPKSLGGFKTSGAGADLHHIRPSESKTNSDRSNDKYGNVTNATKVSVGNLSGLKGGDKGGGYYEPVDNAKGDVARICLYVYARYGTEIFQCSSITNVFESVEVLLEWCELDPVDEWEMGRNDVIEDIQGNRNVFIDYPEFAWLIFDKEIPSDMTTPSGEAKKAVPPTIDSTEGSTESKDIEATPGEGATTEAPSTESEKNDPTEALPSTDLPQTDAPQTDAPQTDACAHTFSEWQDMGNGGKARSCTQCGVFEFASQNTLEGNVDKGCAGFVGGAGTAGVLVAVILGFGCALPLRNWKNS